MYRSKRATGSEGKSTLLEEMEGKDCERRGEEI